MKKQKGLGAPSAREAATDKLYHAAALLGAAAVDLRRLESSHEFASLAAVMADNLATMTANLLSRVQFAEPRSGEAPSPSVIQDS